MLIEIFKFPYISFKSWQTEAPLNSEINLLQSSSGGKKGIILKQNLLFMFLAASWLTKMVRSYK